MITVPVSGHRQRSGQWIATARRGGVDPGETWARASVIPFVMMK